MSVQSSGGVHVAVENIGGIDETSVTLSSGVNVLVGKNATNRTSFLQAVMAALGSEWASLKGDADEGRVELTFDGETYTRTLKRNDGTVVTDGEPYLEDSEAADLFAFLLEMNEARQAVIRGENLRDLIMQPVDTEAITTEIGSLEEEKRRLDDRLEELEKRKTEVPKLEQRRAELKSKIEGKRADIEDKRAELEDADTDIEETREEKRELEEKLEALSAARGRLEETRFQLETERESLQSVQRERNEVETELEEFPDAPTRDRSGIETELQSLRDRKRTLDSTISQLQTLLRFNEDMLSGENELLDVLAEESEEATDAITDRLLTDERTGVCWTCGSRIERAQIDETLDQLRAVIEEKRRTQSQIETSIRDLESELQTLESRQEERERLRSKLDHLSDEIEERTAAIERLEDERASREHEIERLESEVEDLETTEHETLLELHKEANQLEFELGRLQDDLEDVEREIAEHEERLEEGDEIRTRRERIQEKLAELRSKIDRLEADAVDAFNHHMDALLETLRYENLERIWIERTERDVREGRRKVTKSVFDLHVIRSTNSDASYEDTVDHLSESEREVTGLVLGLAGYLVHELYEEVPVMLLDSLEAIDSDRIARLIEYFEEHAPYIVVSLLPEDAAALDDGYRRVTEI